MSHEKFKAATTDPDPTNQKILKLIVDMGNTVLSKRAASDLHKYVDQVFKITVISDRKYADLRESVALKRRIRNDFANLTCSAKLSASSRVITTDYRHDVSPLICLTRV
jgi:hypothetical protein